MSQVVVNPGSWLNLSQLLEFQGIAFWDQIDYPDIPFDDADIYHTLTDAESHRPDLLAFDSYGNAQLLWILLLANDIDLPNQLVEGQVIRIPAKKTINIILAPKNIT